MFRSSRSFRRDLQGRVQMNLPRRGGAIKTSHSHQWRGLNQAPQPGSYIYIYICSTGACALQSQNRSRTIPFGFRTGLHVCRVGRKVSWRVSTRVSAHLCGKTPASYKSNEKTAVPGDKSPNGWQQAAAPISHVRHPYKQQHINMGAVRLPCAAGLRGWCAGCAGVHPAVSPCVCERKCACLPVSVLSPRPSISCV